MRKINRLSMDNDFSTMNPVKKSSERVCPCSRNKYIQRSKRRAVNIHTPLQVILDLKVILLCLCSVIYKSMKKSMPTVTANIIQKTNSFNKLIPSF
jgi:hypothetical protein